MSKGVEIINYHSDHNSDPDDKDSKKYNKGKYTPHNDKNEKSDIQLNQTSEIYRSVSGNLLHYTIHVNESPEECPESDSHRDEEGEHRSDIFNAIQVEHVDMSSAGYDTSGRRENNDSDNLIRSNALRPKYYTKIVNANPDIGTPLLDHYTNVPDDKRPEMYSSNDETGNSDDNQFIHFSHSSHSHPLWNKISRVFSLSILCGDDDGDDGSVARDQNDTDPHYSGSIDPAREFDVGQENRQKSIERIISRIRSRLIFFYIASFLCIILPISLVTLNFTVSDIMVPDTYSHNGMGSGFKNNTFLPLIKESECMRVIQHNILQQNPHHIRVQNDWNENDNEKRGGVNVRPITSTWIDIWLWTVTAYYWIQYAIGFYNIVKFGWYFTNIDFVSLKRKYIQWTIFFSFLLSIVGLVIFLGRSETSVISRHHGSLRNDITTPIATSENNIHFEIDTGGIECSFLAPIHYLMVVQLVSIYIVSLLPWCFTTLSWNLLSPKQLDLQQTFFFYI